MGNSLPNNHFLAVSSPEQGNHLTPNQNKVVPFKENTNSAEEDIQLIDVFVSSDALRRDLMRMYEDIKNNP